MKKDLKQKPVKTRVNKYLEKGYIENLDKLTNAIKDKKVDAGVSRWRDTKNELPDNDILVLTYGETFQYEIHWRHNGNWTKFGHWDYITHWMPLPEPPSDNMSEKLLGGQRNWMDS